VTAPRWGAFGVSAYIFLFKFLLQYVIDCAIMCLQRKTE